jgi:integrase/recombinase XerD
LPEVLGREDIAAILEAASCFRDRMIVGFLYGCGLKIGELRRLRWRDLDLEQCSVQIDDRPGSAARVLPLPQLLLPLLREGIRHCPPQYPVLAGARDGSPLSARRIQVIVRRAAEDAGILKPVTAMTLRHSYAVHALEAGSNVREVQEALGHRFVQSTMRYLACLTPAGTVSPLDLPHPDVSVAGPELPAPALTELRAAVDPGPFQPWVASVGHFVSMLRMQLGPRLFAVRRQNPATGPP